MNIPASEGTILFLFFAMRMLSSRRGGSWPSAPIKLGQPLFFFPPFHLHHIRDLGFLETGNSGVASATGA